MDYMGEDLSHKFQSYEFIDYFLQKYPNSNKMVMYITISVDPKIIDDPKEKEFYRELFYKKLLEGDGHLFLEVCKNQFLMAPYEKLYLSYLDSNPNYFYEFLYPMFDQNIRVDITPEEFIADLEKYKEFYLEKHPENLELVEKYISTIPENYTKKFNYWSTHKMPWNKNEVVN